MTTKQRKLGKSGLIIIGSIAGIMFVVGVIGYLGGKVSNKPAPAGQAGGAAVTENSPSLDFSLTTIGNEPVRLSDYRGKVVFLNFWATWCPPCKMELPSMEKLYERMKGRPFVILAVNVDESDPANVGRFVRDMHLTFPVLLDDGSVSKAYRVNGIPTSFIIRKDGTIDAIVNGARPWNEASYVAAFDKLMAQPYK